jgi:hypothetical protein
MQRYQFKAWRFFVHLFLLVFIWRSFRHIFQAFYSALPIAVYVLFAPFSVHSFAFPRFPCVKALYIDTDGFWYIGNNGKSERVGAKSYIRQSATPNKMPEKCVEMGVSRKSWYLRHLSELSKILLYYEKEIKGLHFVSISFFVEAEYTAKSDVVGRRDFGFSWYFVIFNPDYLGNETR